MIHTEKRRPRAGAGRLSAAVALAAVAITKPALGDIKTWNAASGAWETAGNWPPAVVPVNNDQVFITLNGSTATYTNPVDPFATFSELQINSPGATAATLNMVGS